MAVDLRWIGGCGVSGSFVPGRLSAADYGETLVVRAEVAILGAGAGGSACAAGLAERGRTVAVFEEGRHWKPADFRQDTAWAFKNLYAGRGARSLRGNAVIPLPGGRGVGGSTLINSAICFRTPDPVMKLWREKDGCERVTEERFHPLFDRIWKTIGVTVNPVEVQRNNNLVFKLGAEALGLNGAFLARSAPGCVGCGICQYGCPSGGKFSVDRTFLREAIDTGRVGVFADVRLDTAETAGDKVTAFTGVHLDPETHEPRGPVRVEADEFVVSAGPVASPLFLLGNGLAENTHCGSHLVVHPTIGSLARFPHEIRPWSGVTQGYYVDCWDRGFLLQTFTITPDQYFLLLQTGPTAETMEIMKNLAFLGSAGTLVHDEDSTGRIRHTPGGPDLSYFLGDGDRQRLIEGMRLCAEVFFAAGATEVYPGRIGLKRIGSPSEIVDALPLDIPASHLNLYASHPMGTCRMGGDPATSVVDPRGRVWGWANLSVADASIFPSSLGVNPQVTTMAMGLLVAEAIAEG